MILALDPSLTCTGWALFHRGQLDCCGYYRPAAAMRDRSMAERVKDIAQSIPLNELAAQRVVIEVPQIYTRAKSKGNPNNLTPLWAIAGALAYKYSCADAEFTLPAEWKKQVDKQAMMGRIFNRLTPAEACIFAQGVRQKTPKAPSAKSSAGDAMDAIGIGLHVLGRL